MPYGISATSQQFLISYCLHPNPLPRFHQPLPCFSTFFYIHLTSLGNLLLSHLYLHPCTLSVSWYIATIPLALTLYLSLALSFTGVAVYYFYSETPVSVPLSYSSFSSSGTNLPPSIPAPLKKICLASCLMAALVLLPMKRHPIHLVSD